MDEQVSVEELMERIARHHDEGGAMADITGLTVPAGEAVMLEHVACSSFPGTDTAFGLLLHGRYAAKVAPPLNAMFVLNDSAFAALFVELHVGAYAAFGDRAPSVVTDAMIELNRTMTRFRKARGQ